MTRPFSIRTWTGRSLPGVGWLLLAGAIAVPSVEAQEQGSIDRATLSQALKGLWDSLETLEFQDDNEFHRADGELFLQTRSTFAFQQGGRRALVTVERTSEGEYEMFNVREDGKRRYRVLPEKKQPPGLIKRVLIQNQPGSSDRYQGERCLALQAWWPGGIPLHELVEAASAVEFRGATVGARTALVTHAEPPLGTIRLELDEAHDWLPKTVEFVDVREKLEVKDFTLVNGRWFPRAGAGSRYSERRKSVESTRFEVTNLKINEPIPPTAFRLANLPRDVLIMDETKPRPLRKGPPPEGGKRKEFVTAKPDSGPAPEPIVASRDPEGRPWGLVITIGSVLALASAVVLFVLMRKKT